MQLTFSNSQSCETWYNIKLCRWTSISDMFVSTTVPRVSYFLKGLGDKFSCKSSPNIWHLFAALTKWGLEVE